MSNGERHAFLVLNVIEEKEWAEEAQAILSEKGVRAAPRLSDLEGCLMQVKQPVQGSHHRLILSFKSLLYTVAEMLELLDRVSCCV
jgi:hypothetical protein